jgi:formate hydrogenlyase transcriptional activator
MALVAFTPMRLGPEEDLQPFERLLANVSTRFGTIEADEIDDAVARALEDIGATFAVDDCTLLAFGARDIAQVVHSWAAHPRQPWTEEDVENSPWLVHRLARNTLVAITPATDFPHAAAKDRAHAERTGVGTRMAVPVVVGGRVAYGLIVGSYHRHGSWPSAFVDRLRLIGEILGGALARKRHEESLRATEAEAERLAEPAHSDAVYLQDEARDRAQADEIIGESGSLRLALTRVSQVAALDATVLLLGETGTGKELFARALHNASRRRQRTLIRVNCAALPASLIESELFGHERGAFTGAVSMRQGRFELADRGTIFLDEIGDLAPELQAKLLRVLQEGEFERVGSSKTQRGDVRVIAATHCDLEKAVAEGRFRADLYYRLSVFPISLPTLRQRPEDIPQLVWFFIHRHQRELGRRITRVPAAVMQALQRHDWPGNVRELENVIERAMIRSPGDTLQLDDMPRADRLRAGPPPPPAAAESQETLDAVQRSHIEKVLRECGWRINGVGNAAVRLGLHPNTLRFRIKKLGVVIPGRRSKRAPSQAIEANYA